MSYRKSISSTEELAKWYDDHYRSMGGCWLTPPEDCNKHLDDLGVPFDKSKWLLDVGCGGGHFLEQVSKRVTCVGMEISVAAKTESHKRCKSVPIWIGSIENTYPGVCRSYDYITSIGSLEHVIDLDAALANIRQLLKPDGKWYFYVPNELWKHFDQPNERTHTDEEWVRIFMASGLEMEYHRRWNDSTAFWGGKQ